MHRIPDIKTNAIKMFKQQVACQKDNQSCSNNNHNNINNNNNTLRYEQNILIANNNNNVVVVDSTSSHVKPIITTTTSTICNQKTKYNNSNNNNNHNNSVILDNKAQQSAECAYIEIMPAQQTQQYYQSQTNVGDTLANSCDLELVDNDGENKLHVNEVTTHSADGEYLKKHQHIQHSDDAHCVRVVTSFQRTSNVRTPAECHELEYDVDVGTVLEADGLQFVPKATESSDNAAKRETNASQIVDGDSFEASVCLDRNARRPMNAFLIFCKRHRAIVKERYKSLENRAITKILGDWWASLDANEKHCFTNLAQKNKDAFFNANPNFKWYKLPAPPLRPSYTRPNSGSIDNVNQSRLAVINSYIDETHLTATDTDTAIGTVQTMPKYFKMTEGKRNDMLSNRMIKDNEQALQMALSETTQFLTNSMPNKSYYHKTNSLKTQTQQSDDVCSSSDDEYSIPSSTIDKSTRRCKGKIYQQLIKSGRIVASAKKMKPSAMQLQQSSHLFYNKSDISATLQSKHFMSLNEHVYESSQTATTATTTTATRPTHPNTFSQYRNADKCEVVNANLPYTFDLDKKIKELPALNLDAYLQRKHNTNKKTKFNTKKQRRAAANSVRLATTATISKTVAKDLLKQQQVGKECLPDLRAANAVGSRKRKARKESITRRDLSIIEQEISSIMPLTINGCYYFNECVINPLNVHTAAPKTFAHNSATIDSASSSLTLASPTLSSSSSSLSFDPLTADGGATNASDLLILAEVAANRTDFAKQ